MEENKNKWYEVTYYVTGVGSQFRQMVLASSVDSAIRVVKSTHSVPERAFGHWAWECDSP
tara:strand:+ start:1137 stop:1316 length:180 start_codon:yes stop_codon:yes gene_type:complete